MITDIAGNGKINDKNSQQNEATAPSWNCSCLQNPPKNGKATKKIRRPTSCGYGLYRIKINGKNDEKYRRVSLSTSKSKFSALKILSKIIIRM